MKKIGITQRVDFYKEIGERRDALDQQLGVFCWQLDTLPVPLCNNIDNPGQYLKNLDPDGFILSGGNDLKDLPGAKNTALERDKFEKEVIQYAMDNMLPVLGICRGFQVLNDYFGGQLSRIENHVATIHEIDFDTKQMQFLPECHGVNSYHEWGVKTSDLAPQMETLAICRQDKSVEAFYHPAYPFIGIMWHPEREHKFSDVDKNIFRHVFFEEGRI